MRRAHSVANFYSAHNVRGMNLGDDTAEAHQHLSRQLRTIDIILNRAAEVRLPPEPGSDFDVLVERIGETPVFLGRGLQTYLRTTIECLLHAKMLLTAGQSTSTIVLQALLRPALMASGRAVFILGSDDRDTQYRRALTVLRQECESYLRAMRSFSGFRHIDGLRPRAEALAEVEAAVSSVRAHVPQTGEGRVLDEMAKHIAGVVQRESNDVEVGVVGEIVQHVWHTFSGGAHGYVWPDNLPGDIVTSLGVVVPVAHWAMDLAVRRTRA